MAEMYRLRLNKTLNDYRGSADISILIGIIKDNGLDALMFIKASIV